MKKVIAIFWLMISFTSDIFGQCAMCRATLESKVSNGEAGIASGINIGILYLFVMPYLLVGIIGYMWYRQSRKNRAQVEDSSG